MDDLTERITDLFVQIGKHFLNTQQFSSFEIARFKEEDVCAIYLNTGQLLYRFNSGQPGCNLLAPTEYIIQLQGVTKKSSPKKAFIRTRFCQHKDILKKSFEETLNKPYYITRTIKTDPHQIIQKLNEGKKFPYDIDLIAREISDGDYDYLLSEAYRVR